MKPREKLLECGAKNLKDEELLAILLRTGVKGKNVIDFSRQLLNDSGGFSGLLDMEINDLLKIKGINISKATLLKAILEVVQRYFKEKIDVPDFVLNNPEVVYRFLMTGIKWEDREKFVVMFLNNASDLMDFETMFLGNINSVPLFISEILKKALRKGARGIIVAHNHITGNLSPSKEDMAFTTKLKKACELVEIVFVDHLIFNHFGFFSFKQQGFI